MTAKTTDNQSRPTIGALRKEIKRIDKRGAKARFFIVAVNIIVLLPALTVLITNLWINVLIVDSDSMTPTLQEGEVIFGLINADVERGKIVSFEKEKEIFIKRVIGVGGDEIDISIDGVLLINGERLIEPYLQGETTRESFEVSLPYVVPHGSYFVMGDNRMNSIDSRSEAFGVVKEQQLLGVIQFR